MPEGPSQDEIVAEFTRQLAGLDPGGLQALAGQMLDMVGPLTGRIPRDRRSLRRPPLETPVTLRVRVDLNHAQPPIWRRLEVPSDIPLDVLHELVQTAFGWTNSHLHRFALGGSPFDLTSELFLCPYDVEEGEDEGTPDSAVRLDECLREPGDELHYVYDYGDNWDLTIRLEAVREETIERPVCVDGRRAAPPEDCGSLRTAEELAEVVADPAAFDVAEVNQALASPIGSFSVWASVLQPPVRDLLARARSSRPGEALLARAQSVASGTTGSLASLSEEEIGEALRAHLWFLDQCSGGGLPLTSAGYLKPEKVAAAAELVPSMAGWIGKNNRETHTAPVLDFRETLRSLGLLRKYKGSLLVTRAGAALRARPSALAEYLAQALAKRAGVDGVVGDIDRLVLLWTASGAGKPLNTDVLAELLHALGWRLASGRRAEWWQVRHDSFAESVLAEVRPRTSSRYAAPVSPVSAAIAREALLTP